jgi:hypothetical protein
MLRQQLIQLAHEKPLFGYRRLHILLRRTDQRINRKRVQRVYRAARLCVRRIRRKRLSSYLQRQPLRRQTRNGPLILLVTSPRAGNGYACSAWWTLLLVNAWR